MTERLTVEDLRKAYTDYYGIPLDYRQKVKEAAQRAVANYDEMTDKAKHSAEDLQEVLDKLVDNEVNNMADPEFTSRLEWDLHEAKEWVERTIRDIVGGRCREEERL